MTCVSDTANTTGRWCSTLLCATESLSVFCLSVFLQDFSNEKECCASVDTLYADDVPCNPQPGSLPLQACGPATATYTLARGLAADVQVCGHCLVGMLQLYDLRWILRSNPDRVYTYLTS